jgi:hypothetical protein
MLPFSSLQKPGGVGSINFDGSSSIGDVLKQTGTGLIGKATSLRQFIMNGPSLNTSTNFYVNHTTGNDANNGSFASPWKTIQGSFNNIALGFYSGAVILNIADGTYTEEIITPTFFGGALTTLAPSYVVMFGNLATPANVVIHGSGGVTFGHYNNPTVYWMAGCTLTGNGLGTGIMVENSFLRMLDVDVLSGYHIGIDQLGGYIDYTAGNGGHIFGSLYSLFALAGGRFVASSGQVLLSGATNQNIYAAFGSFILMYNGAQCIGDVAAGCGCNVAAIEDSTVQFQGTTLFKHSNTYGVIVDARSIVEYYGAAMTVTYDNCTLGAVNANNLSYIVSQMSTGAGGGSSYINGTPAVIALDPSSVAQAALDGYFTGATTTFTNLNFNIHTGGDYRFANTVTVGQVGALTPGVTQFMTPTGLSASYFPIHQAVDAEQVYSLQIVGETNGGGHTDTYTIYKNGVATTMVATLVAGKTVITLASPVSLAAGDTIGIYATTDAGTTAANVLATARVIKK